MPVPTRALVAVKAGLIAVRDFDYSHAMTKVAAILTLLIMMPLPAACSGSEKLNAAQEAADDNAVAADPTRNASAAAMEDGAMEARIVRPVTIGEDGPSLDACGTNGRVTGVRHGDTLPLRAAPFGGATASRGLPNGALLYICTRSVDQRWLGVVVAPAEPGGNAPDEKAPGNTVTPPAVDCGVSSPVDSKRPYVGSCRSGWVTASFVRLIAG